MSTDDSAPESGQIGSDSSGAHSHSGLVFRSLKENRDAYFVEYTPALASDGLAKLSLVFVEQPSKPEIASLMEIECRTWMKRFSVPLFVSAFDLKDDVIHPCEDDSLSYLLGTIASDGIALHWRGNGSSSIPINPIDDERLLAIYQGIPHSTKAERSARVRKAVRAQRIGWLLVVAWLVGVPLLIELIGFANPILGIVLIMYSIFKAIVQARKMLGYAKKSEREKAKEEEEARMRHHHHHHCELNPEGFARLKHENFVREAREQTLKEKRDLEE